MIIRVEKARIDKFFAYFRTSIVTDIFVLNRVCTPRTVFMVSRFELYKLDWVKMAKYKIEAQNW